jgi:hypothetical protein
MYISSALIVYLVVTGLLHATAHARAKEESDDSLIYGPTALVRAILIILILGFTFGAVYVSVSRPPLLVGTAIFGFIAVAATFAFPSKIIVRRRSISEIKWWGTTIDIPWADVSRIEYHRGPSTTVLRGKHGGKVVHSGWNRDSVGFLKICEQRTGRSAQISEL